MRVSFLLQSVGPSGGAAVAAEHAGRLISDHGVDAELVVMEEATSSTSLEGVAVRSLAEARGERYDVAVATWWQTVPALWELDTSRRVLLLQSFEQRFYGADAPFERLGAEATLAVPLDFVTVSSWMRDLLAEIRPGARCRVVRPGIDKAVFSGTREVRRAGPLKVLIEGQPTLSFKGVEDAVAAVGQMQEPAHSTLVALDPAAVGDVAVDRVVGGLDPEGMAALYRECDVLVKLSRVEGLGLAPIEAFHCGLPCVLTPYTGHEEYARHCENAVVVGFDDLRGTAGWLDLLARDRDVLARLSDGARATAERWPSPDESTRLLHDALLEIAESEPPAADESLLLRTLALNGELGRTRFSRRDAATEDALIDAAALIRELSESRDECADRLNRSQAELDRIRNSRPYRLASAVKRAVGRGRRG